MSSLGPLNIQSVSSIRSVKPIVQPLSISSQCPLMSNLLESISGIYPVCVHPMSSVCPVYVQLMSSVDHHAKSSTSTTQHATSSSPRAPTDRSLYYDDGQWCWRPVSDHQFQTAFFSVNRRRQQHPRSARLTEVRFHRRNSI